MNNSDTVYLCEAPTPLPRTHDLDKSRLINKYPQCNESNGIDTYIVIPLKGGILRLGSAERMGEDGRK